MLFKIVKKRNPKELHTLFEAYCFYGNNKKQIPALEVDTCQNNPAQGELMNFAYSRKF